MPRLRYRDSSGSSGVEVNNVARTHSHSISRRERRAERAAAVGGRRQVFGISSGYNGTLLLASL